jgi:transposase-like protein
MVSHLFFYQLALVSLVWLRLMLHWAWPSDHAAVCPTAPEPTPTRRKRSREPKPFAGLTRKPHCDACEHATAPHPLAPSAPPPRIVPTRGRRRHVDTSTHFCPNPGCAYRGWVGWGNLRANGHPNGGSWQQLLCVACRHYFLETLGTLFHGKRTPIELIVRVIACLAEGLGIRGTARVFEVDPNTVLQWLVEAAEQMQAFARHVVHDVRVQQVQLDELFALLSAVKDGKVSEAEAIERLERSPQWVWVAMDPESKLVLAIGIGARTLSENCSKPQDEVMLEQSWHYACSGCPKEHIVAEVARLLGLAQEDLLSSEG